MRPLEELIDTAEPAIDLVRAWLEEGGNPYELLPPSSRRAGCLHETQVTTRSPMGALVYESGGLLVDHGWLRFPGSGHPRLLRDLPGWNRDKGEGLLLVADDVLGGFFALNGRALGPGPGQIYYLPYDGLEWEGLDIGYSAFLAWSATPRLAEFYAGTRWEGWEAEAAALTGDQCFSFYPFLWSAEGSVQSSRRGAVPVSEAYALKQEFVRQLGPSGRYTAGHWDVQS